MTRSPLEVRFEKRLEEELAQINTTALDAEKGQGLTWPAKERVAFYEVVADYLTAKRQATPSPNGFGSKLTGGGD